LVSHSGRGDFGIDTQIKREVSQAHGVQEGEGQLAALERAWSEVIPVERVRERARRLLETHPLRAADSLQLAPALLTSEETLKASPLSLWIGDWAVPQRKKGFTLSESEAIPSLTASPCDLKWILRRSSEQVLD
jgi:hypothetical protein